MKNFILLFLFSISISLLNAQVLTEDFESTSATIGTFPNGWTTSNSQWTINDPSTGTPGNNGNNTIVQPFGSSTSSGNCTNVYAIVDSDGLGQGNTQNTDLISPIMDLSNYTALLLEFNHSFEVYSGPVAKVEASIDSGATWTLIHDFGSSSNYGHQIFNISSLTGNSSVQIRFHYEGDWDWWWAIDDIEVKQANSVDMEMSSLNIPFFDAGGSTNITGVVTNFGADTVTSFDIVWDDGNGPQSETFNVSLAFNESYNFTHSSQIQTNSLQTYNIDVEVIVSGDADSTNNMLSHTLYTSSFLPFKKVLFEDQTIGANDFGYWSPRGIVRLEEVMLTSSIDSIEIISVHGNVGGGTDDAMYNLIYNAACFGNAFVSASAYPQNIIDRKTVANYGVTIGSTIEDFNDFKNDFGVADIEVFPFYDTSNRNLTVATDVKFAINYSNLNLALVITEDSVHDDTDLGYSQFNAYNGGGNGPLASSGVDFSIAGNPVPPALMYFKNVAREIIPSYIGSSTALPSNLIADSTYSFTFPTYSVPSDYDQSKLRAIVLLIDPSNLEVYNANGKNVDAPPPSTVGFNKINLDNEFVVFPNPAFEKVFIKLNFDLKSDAEITLKDLSGKVILRQVLNAFQNASAHELNKPDISSGIYILTLKNEKYISSKKIIFN